MIAKWWNVNFGFKDKTLSPGIGKPMTFGDWAKVFGYGEFWTSIWPEGVGW